MTHNLNNFVESVENYTTWALHDDANEDNPIWDDVDAMYIRFKQLEDVYDRIENKEHKLRLYEIGYKWYTRSMDLLEKIQNDGDSSDDEMVDTSTFQVQEEKKKKFLSTNSNWNKNYHDIAEYAISTGKYIRKEGSKSQEDSLDAQEENSNDKQKNNQALPYSDRKTNQRWIDMNSDSEDEKELENDKEAESVPLIKTIDNYKQWAIIDDVNTDNPIFFSPIDIEQKVFQLREVYNNINDDNHKKTILKIIHKWKNQKLTIDDIEEDWETNADLQWSTVENKKKKSKRKIDKKLQTFSKEKASLKNVNNSKDEILQKSPDKKKQKHKDNYMNNKNTPINKQAVQTTFSPKNSAKMWSNFRSNLISPDNNPKTLQTPKIRRIHQTRFAFKSSQMDDSTEETKKEINRICKRFLEIAMTIDKECMLLPWEDKENSLLRPLKKLDIDKLGLNLISKYICFPKKKTDFLAQDTIYGSGIRIQTKISVDNFVEAWNMRKNDPTEKDKEWISIKRAETQKYSNSYLIGFFQGSSEKGIYSTLNNKLNSSKLTNS